MNIAEHIQNSLARHREALAHIHDLEETIADIGAQCTKTLRNGGKLIFAGNGGSAADAQHLAAELVGRFLKDRRPLPALALTTNTSILTSVANDYGYQEVFLRQLQALGQSSDILFVISTSGESPNLLRAAEYARRNKIHTVGLLGKKGGRLRAYVDTACVVQHQDTPRIQEMHILIGHILCDLIETELKEDA
ncbi:MAG: SIS domain-containing protein [Candidatus Omnitrophica bacterium]|nr:SIS domain-containing protein [Candidatus Omnitrophota bacterium]